MSNSRLRLLGLHVVTAVFLLACGGGGGGSATIPSVTSTTYSGASQVKTYSSGAQQSFDPVGSAIASASDNITKTTTYTYSDGATNRVVSTVSQKSDMPTYAAGVQTIVATYGDGTTATANNNSTSGLVTDSGTFAPASYKDGREAEPEQYRETETCFSSKCSHKPTGGGATNVAKFRKGLLGASIATALEEGEVKIDRIARFKSPWAIAVTPFEGLLITDNAQVKAFLVNEDGVTIRSVKNLPENMTGLFDVKIAPDFLISHIVYFSFAEKGGENTPRVGRQRNDFPDMFPSGLAIVMGELKVSSAGVSLENTKVIWRQAPKIVGQGEFGGRMAFSPDGHYLFIAAGDRQEFMPVQDLNNTLGKVVRILKDGRIPSDNPFVGNSVAKPEIWSLGHRNQYGLIFTPDGRLWSTEHGPAGGDELNLIMPGKNYGWPMVSWGDHYDGGKIEKPTEHDGYQLPVIDWTPAIAPTGFTLIKNSQFLEWDGDAIVTGLRSMGLVRIRFNGAKAEEVDRFNMGVRVRDIAQANDGSLWVLEDAPAGYLLKVAPRKE